MKEEFNTICSLNFLSGTLATAYKGTITSLVVKDFCISDEKEAVLFKGTVLSMPDGAYEISLTSNGKELVRSPIVDGYFEIRSPAYILSSAKGLQLDVVQSGKHIGTFLLKKEASGGLFVSAIEIAKDLQGIPFKTLSESISEKSGLLKKGEEIIADVFSTKKDRKKLSDMINTFSRDLYWHAHESFLLWYPLLVRTSSNASVDAAASSDMRMVSNVVALLELPLEKEPDKDFLRQVITIWLSETERAKADISLRFERVLALAREISRRFPSIKLAPLLERLLGSVEKRAGTALSISNSFFAGLSRFLDPEAASHLEVFSQRGREHILETIRETERLSREGRPAQEIIEHAQSINASSLEEDSLIESVFQTLIRNLDSIREDDLVPVVSELALFITGIDAGSSSALTALPGNLMKHLLKKNRNKACRALLSALEGSERRDEMALNRQVAELIAESGDTQLFETYCKLLLSIPIPSPGISGVSEDTWAERADPLHLKRLTGFLEVITTAPRAFRGVLIHVICNLFLHAPFIPDDRLFQRNISRYLNALDGPDDRILHHIFLKKLPVYYNEIGATGRIRDLSTQIDSWGNDPVIYFLRKQVHVNASGNNISLIERLLEAWTHNDRSFLDGVVPADILSGLSRNLMQEYSQALRPMLGKLGAMRNGTVNFRKIRSLPDDAIDASITGVEGSEEARKKCALLCKIYGAVFRKYSIRAGWTGEGTNPFSDLDDSLRLLHSLYETVFSSEKTQPEESLYFKRHIAFGIPSVIGTYHEAKFDALSEALRTEEKARLSLEAIIDRVTATPAVGSDEWRMWLRSLEAAADLFSLHGMPNARIEETLTITKENRLHVSQLLDILRLLQGELTWIVERFYRTFHRPLMHTLGLFSHDEFPEHIARIGPFDEHFLHRASDILIRDMINCVAGFEETDRLLNSMIRSLSLLVESGSDPEFAPEKITRVIDNWFDISSLRANALPRLAPLLGTKARNLVYLRQRNIPVPFGIVFSACKTGEYETYVRSSEFADDLREAVNTIETATGRKFGGAAKPLFLSVRSGSFISMPGILSSILYCGMNKETFNGFLGETGDEWLCLDSWRRFIEHYATIVFDIDTAYFNRITSTILAQKHTEELHNVDTGMMRTIVNKYTALLQKMGLHIPSDPEEQLRQSVMAIYRSWFHFRSKQYRKAMNISPWWGTSVTLMEMKTVNTLGSGASVFLTRNPLTLDRTVYGETRERGTGDDIVYGKINNSPLSKEQTGERISLEEKNPPLYRAHRELADNIENAMGGIPQEVEAAYETTGNGIRMWVLQTRRMEFRRSGREHVKDECMLESNIIGRGLGVHGGALNGIITFETDPQRIRDIREKADLPVILLRKEISTDDVAPMSEVDGIVTSTGGVTSHASVLAQKFNLTAIVGCTDMLIDLSDPSSPRAVIGHEEVWEGSQLSMDGSTGLVYSGLCTLPVEEE